MGFHSVNFPNVSNSHMSGVLIVFTLHRGGVPPGSSHDTHPPSRGHFRRRGRAATPMHLSPPLTMNTSRWSCLQTCLGAAQALPCAAMTVGTQPFEDCELQTAVWTPQWTSTVQVQGVHTSTASISMDSECMHNPMSAHALCPAQASPSHVPKWQRC